MDLYAKGQLSFLILNCLQERDFYGLDIISEISERSNGKINLKKPSVYSNLTRMEKQGFVSAYLQSSDLGPNRKYYSVTEKGRNFFKELHEYFERNNIDVFRDFSDDEVQEKPTQVMFDLPEVSDQPEKNEPEEQPVNEEKTQEEDYFDFSSLDESVEEPVEKDVVKERNEDFSQYITTNSIKEDSAVNETTEESVIDDIKEEAQQEDKDKVEQTTPDTELYAKEKIDESENNIEQEQQAEPKTEKTEEPKDDAVFLNNENPGEYNQRIYDISKDINRYRNRKSFAEDQISITVNSPLSASNERTNQNIQSIRDSLDLEKNDPNRISQYDFSEQMEYRFNKTNENEEVKDDAKFITDRVDVVQKARKITPPRLQVVENAGVKETKLPPPKRDTSIDPSHKEILSRLYLKTKDSTTNEVRDDAIYDYVDLKDYYKGQHISFTEYKKSALKNQHNTNKLYFILSIFTLVCASIISALTYITFRYTNQLNVATNFLYIVLPALLIIDFAWKLYNFKIYTSWLPKQMLAPWKVWLMTVIFVGAVIGLNAFWGYGQAPFATFATTLILPILLILLLVPARYYVKRFMLVKYWR